MKNKQSSILEVKNSKNSFNIIITVIGINLNYVLLGPVPLFFSSVPYLLLSITVMNHLSTSTPVSRILLTLYHVKPKTWFRFNSI